MDGGMPNNFQTSSARPIRELEAEITELAGHINAASYRWLTLIAEFDNRNGWSDWAAQSCAHWLNWKCGITLGAAREKVRVAHALEKLPKIAAAMERGELSYYKVRELTRVAAPETEDTLLMIAQHGTATHVETVVRHFRRAKEADELSREAEQQANRFLSYQFDDDGSLVLRARLTAEAGAVMLKALNVAMEEDFNSSVRPESVAESESVPAGTSTVKSTPRMKRADALSIVAESFLQHGAEAMSGGDKHNSAEVVSRQLLGVSQNGSTHPKRISNLVLTTHHSLVTSHGACERALPWQSTRCWKKNSEYSTCSQTRSQLARQGLQISRLLQHEMD